MNPILFHREQTGLTQSELSRLIGVSTKTVSRWESNQREPRASELLKLARTFRVNVADLLVASTAEERNTRKVTLSELIAWLTRWAPEISEQIDDGHEIANIVVDFMDPSHWNDETIRLKKYIKEGIPNLERLCALMAEVPDEIELEKAG